ncbi:MAG: class I SAM-dependent methyltransferase [Proteobacteria bacterium]|nr:class I SAM-dependent methyltransferase [Pseudomonadota bacterium]
MTANRWDERYAGEEHWYGTEPNDFLRENIERLPRTGRVLSLGEGEGRNAAFIAARGPQVVAVDGSAVGLEKARRLAKARGVSIETVNADLGTFALEPQSWDAIISIWCHLESGLRRRVHRDVVTALRPGGVFLLEAYTPDQLRHGTGGPREPDLLVRRDDLVEELAGLEILHAAELERDVHEGRGHGGRSAVVQFIGRKPG